MPVTGQAETLCNQAREARQKGRLEEAAGLFDQALKADASSIPAWEGRGYVAFAMKDLARAIECFKKVSMLDVRRPQPMINLGAVYNKQGAFNDAVKALRQAISRDRKSAEAYYNLGIAHRGLNQLSLAVSAYKEAIKANDQMHEAHQNLANVFVEMNNMSQAKVHYQKALEIKPDFEAARRGLDRAQQAAESARKNVNPFGRLVNTADLENAKVGSTFRELTVQERVEDRHEKFRLMKEIESKAAGLAQSIHQDITNGLHKLTSAMAQRDDPHQVTKELAAFKQSRKQFEKQCEAFEQLTRELRAHEKLIREGAG
jgi:tetratricopeptide (TPR) repeat protein